MLQLQLSRAVYTQPRPLHAAAILGMSVHGRMPAPAVRRVGGGGANAAQLSVPIRSAHAPCLCHHVCARPSPLTMLRALPLSGRRYQWLNVALQLFVITFAALCLYRDFLRQVSTAQGSFVRIQIQTFQSCNHYQGTCGLVVPLLPN